jgi:2-oxoglutarate ferredoxin oxidoreductase subunit beta
MRGEGFSMVEILSACPTNWKMSPVEAIGWQEQNMVPFYPLGEIKNTLRSAEEKAVAAN